MKQFPNGFDSWQETHFEIVSEIIDSLNNEDTCPTIIQETQDRQGRGGLYDLALDWTNEFEKLHKGKIWDGDFFDEIDKFLENKYNDKNTY